MSDFNSFSFDAPILRILKEIGYEKPTPVQALAIPKVMNGLDLVACAQTGTGKTGAFLLPALHTLCKSPQQKFPQILILVPTRELAMQIAKEAEKYSKYLNQIKTVCIYGGVPYPPQKRALSKPFDILIATPGRLMDHMDRGLINLSKIKTLVLDEADRMLDMGFLEPVEFISSACPKGRQTLLFSATIDKKILQVSQKIQKNPEEIRLEPDDMSKSNIDQKLYFTDNLAHKMRLLDHFLENQGGQTIVFTSTKRQADEIAENLQEQGKRAEALHGDMNQRQRTRAVEKLRKNQINILVATDVAARGIDIPSLGFVINVDLPFKPEDYVHRIGRTGRAGAKGDAITFASRQDRSMVVRIERLMGKPIAIHTVPGMEPQNKPESKDGPRRRGNSRFGNRGRSGGGPRKGFSKFRGR
ncbi:MAG TPA: DEAD/DEAH box helicase [Chlamydiales bacterium]|nr:DEAD/DEAH box helicase [Chlamydiales bacterium]